MTIWDGGMGESKATIVVRIENNTNSRRQLRNEVTGTWWCEREMMTTISGKERTLWHPFFVLIQICSVLETGHHRRCVGCRWYSFLHN